MHRAVFPPETHAAFAALYPHTPGKLGHRLIEQPLLTLEALAELAASLPAASIEYNPGDVPIGIAPEDIPAPRLGVVETIRNIGEAASWVVLKRIEQHPEYAALLREVLGELRDIVEPRTGAMLQIEGFIFVSSGGSVTPFHFDPEHNILLQITGSKIMTVFPVEDEELFAAPVHEQFHLGEHHRNLPWRDTFAAKGVPIEIAPGEAIHVPVKAPHWVQNGPEPSISLSLTWRSEWSYAEADARAFNRMLRGWGVEPNSPGAYPAQNRSKALAYRAVRRLGLRRSG
jgi:hypothetical protein